MRLHFLGANRQVTGSCYLLEAAGRQILIDCGMFQERRFRERNHAPWPFDPRELDAVVLTHAHLDHCGLIPRLVKEGFRGPIVTQRASAELGSLVMEDSGRLQERRADDPERDDYLDREPLYTEEHATAAGRLFVGIGFDTPHEISHDVGLVLHEAGHILGSASVELVVREHGGVKTLVFSGDLGQFGKPLIRDPSPPPRADVLVLESTYGDAAHGPDSADFTDADQPSPKDDAIEDRLEAIIKDTQERGGKLIIPTFAVERAQEVLYYLARLSDAKRFTNMPVYLDSPLGVEVTKVFQRYKNLFDPQAMQELHNDGRVLGFKGLRLCDSREESMAINEARGPAIILAGSGMCTGGRVVHHLVRYVDEPDSTVLFVGYQSHDTLGRDLLDGRSPVRILDATKTVRARIEKLARLSGHADRPSIFRWLDGFQQKPGRVFLTHGEEDASEALAGALRRRLGGEVAVPHYRETIEL